MKNEQLEKLEQQMWEAQWVFWVSGTYPIDAHSGGLGCKYNFWPWRSAHVSDGDETAARQAQRD